MKYLNSILLALLLVTATVTVPANAQDKAEATEAQQDDSSQKEEKKADDPVLEQLRANNPYLDKLQEASVEFIKDVPDDGVKALYLIREAYGILRSVHSVKKDVGHAVDLCGKENSDLEGDMDSRFKEWSDNVTPALKTQDEKLDALIKKQSYKKPKDVKSYLKNIDNAAEYADKMLDKQVVTTPDACQSLLESMDRTETNIVELLGQTAMPELNDDGTAVDKNVAKEDESAEEDAGDESTEEDKKAE